VAENALDPLEKTLITFHTDPKGQVSSLSAPFEPLVKDIVFNRVPEKRMRERSFLEPFTGEYEVPGQTLTISLRGNDTLVATLPGRPAMELVPDHGTTFKVSGVYSNFTIEFQQDASGKVTGAVLTQASGTSMVRKK